MQNLLQQLVFGPSHDDPGTATTLAHSAGLSPEQGALFRQRIVLEPFSEEPSQALALVGVPMSAVVGTEDAVFVFARAVATEAGALFQYIVLPSATRRALMGDLSPLIQLVETPLETPPTSELPELTLRMPAPWDAETLSTIIQRTLHRFLNNDFELYLSLAGAAISPQGMLIRHFPEDLSARLTLVQGIMALLPPLGRSHLTFNSHAPHFTHSRAAIIFSESDGETQRHSIDWQALAPIPEVLSHPYVAHLAGLWQNNALTLARDLEAVADLAEVLMPLRELAAGLAESASRHALDRAVLAGETVRTEALIQVLLGEMKLPPAMRLAYIERLLAQALDERDTYAAEIVAHEMDRDPALDDQLNQLLANVRETEPDAVYAFVRARCALGVEPRWLERLHLAAQQALDIAISEGDWETLTSWLRLISREPAAYDLSHILREGVLRAAARASEAPELAHALLTIAVKRDNAVLDALLRDQNVLPPLDDAVGLALREIDGQAIADLVGQPRELFLLAIGRAIQAQRRVLSADLIKALWEIHRNSNLTILPAYQPRTLLLNSAQAGDAVLQAGAVEALILLALADDEDEMFIELARALATHHDFNESLVPALMLSGRSAESMLIVLNNLMTQAIITARFAIETMAHLLDEMAWTADALPMAEQLARTLNQHQDVPVATSVMWKMLEVASEARNDLLGRVALRRLLAEVTEQSMEVRVVDSLVRLRSLTQWSANLRQRITDWWRTYTRDQSLTQLQKLEKTLEGKRGLDDARNIVRTTIALRRVLGNRPLTELAEQIALTFTLLQAIADNFDPDGKQTLSIDTATVREAFSNRTDELTLDQRHVLATNLRELAQLITSMADNRSKPSLMRSDDALERQLLSGEQQPQSAIDLIKWLSGYLEGNNGEEDRNT